MNRYLSDKFRIISFVSIIMVVLLHSYNIPGEFSIDNLTFNKGYNFFIQFFLSQGICRIAVPIFFCVSGYLFFLRFECTLNEITIKYKKRAKSVLLPYLIWSIWGLVFFFLLQTLPFSKSYFTNKVINYSLCKILNIIFFNPIPYQLWFLRDLIVLITFSPLIYLLIKLLRLIPLLIIFVFWLEILEINLDVFFIEGLFYFSIGAYFSIYNNTIVEKKLNQKSYLFFSFFWILFVLIKTILSYISYKLIVILLIHKLSVIFGILSVWSIYDLLMMNKICPNKVIYNLSFYSFFIYVFHEPTLTIIKKGTSFFTQSFQIISLITYFLNPFIVITISVFVASFVKAYLPKFYKLITGGR